jgi:hypothetical protein
MRAIHIVALAPFVIGAILIIPELLDVTDYYQKLATCEQGACPDVVPSYANTTAGITVASIGMVILLVDWFRRRTSRTTYLAK